MMAGLQKKTAAFQGKPPEWMERPDGSAPKADQAE
ncbi:hypothetical protein L905_26585 [Agrobacterium sp. TS43]|nr:hypothetical protein L902_23395 [Agrobacterium radiobacter DSM 30147]KVK40230.1 hypothetical protein L903_14475 [Agrobacterium sp. JL28]KVK40778.1 hypothetical protein L904_14465 [Agrobacterium sp. LY4]KVK54707.1 hypothetical protein L906_14425 [Agrobacterium sp. TS45]KVK70957.1 hypothetical protein L905_26585 [Agrobacterium sp. TS43]